MRTPVVRGIVVACFAAALLGCAPPPPATTPTIGGAVQYGDAKAVERLTNEFGSTDLQAIAESMARSMAQSLAGEKVKPLITIAEVKNKTSEYIDTRSITDSIRAQLLKSGTVRFATDISAMQPQVDELNRQSNPLYKQNSAAKVGRMEGAKYRIEGNLTSIVKRTNNVMDVYYKFSLILTNNEAGTIDWADEKEIRKTSAR